MGWAVLKITDGTTTIDLLNTNGGILLDDWRPAIQVSKAGGVWNGSPVTDGRRLAMRHYENAIEILNLKISDVSQDKLIMSLQNLFRLLDKAVYYWTTSWQETPVWIEARATNETNSRYAVIHDYRIAGLNNPYSQPFFACPSAFDEIALTIERDYWQENIPGTVTPVSISAQQVYNGVTYGQEATTTEDQVFIANRHTRANITHVFYYDASGAAFSGNLIGAAKPTAFLPNPPQDGDILYFGCSTAVADSGPFPGIVMDISVGAGAVTSVEWEDYDGAWGSMPAEKTNLDTPTPFAAGLRYIAFDHTASFDWATVDVNGVTGYWVRAVFTIGGGAAVFQPFIQNRDIYAPIFPFVDISATQIPGDVPALSEIKVTNYCTDTASGNNDQESILYAAIRTLGRGADFTPYINLSDEQNPTGITLAAGSDVALDTSEKYYAVGSGYEWTPTDTADEVRLTISFTASAFANYRNGRYATFLRYYNPSFKYNYINLESSVLSTDGLGNTSKKTIWESQYVATPYETNANQRVMEFGIMQVPDISTSGFQIEISAYAAAAGGGNSIKFCDLILMPVDEWFAKYSATSYGRFSLGHLDYIIVDSASDLKDYHRAVVYTSADELKTEMSVNAAGPSILQANTAQRLWFFSSWNLTGTQLMIMHNDIFSVSLSRQARYMAMRGNR